MTTDGRRPRVLIVGGGFAGVGASQHLRQAFKYFDKGTMATIGRGAAVVRTPRGRTMKGKAAQLAWGSVHLALLPTNEDRAQAVVDWAGAGLTHQRAGRITVGTAPERTDGVA